MSDEPILNKPPMPRRPEKRKPAPKRDLRKKDQAKIDEVEFESEMLSLDERACALLCTEYSAEEAAVRLGWDLQDVHSTLAQPHVRLFLKKADEGFIKELSKAKVRRTLKVGISRAGIEQRLFELMMLDPSETKGSIEGQVKAAIALAEKFGYGKENDPLAVKTPQELEDIVRRAHGKLLDGKTGASLN